MKREILIATADTSTGKLGLTIDGANAETIEVEKLDKVYWSIGANNVYSFKIEKKGDSKQIFTILDRPSSKHTKGTNGTVSYFSAGDDYIYCIKWKDRVDGPDYKHDPKISVLPSFSILPIVIGLASFVSLAFLISKISKR